MNKIYSFLIFLLLSFTSLVLGQGPQCNSGGCYNLAQQNPSGTFTTQSNSWSLVGSCMIGGNYAVFDVNCGSVYEWTTCTDFGGMQAWDVELTLLDMSNNILCYQDNSNRSGCPDAPYLGWTSTYTGQVKILVTESGCTNTTSGCNTIVWKESQAGFTPTSPIVTAQPDPTNPTGAIKVSWGAITGATDYTVVDCSSNNVVAQVTTNEAIIGGLSSGSSYSYKVKACSGTTCCSGWSACAAAVLSSGILNGQTVWSKSIIKGESSRLLSVEQTIDGGYIASGYDYDYDSWTTNYEYSTYILRTDYQGNTLWTDYLSQGGESTSISQTTDGEFIYNYNWRQSSGFNGNPSEYASGAALRKIDTTGSTTWYKSYLGHNSFGPLITGVADWSNGVKQTLDGGYCMIGIDGTSPFLFKTNSLGDSSWANTFNYQNGRIESFEQTSDSGFILAGSKGTGSWHSHIGDDFWVIKTDINGDTVWTQTYGGADEDIFYSVQQTKDGGYILAGSTRSLGNGDEDIYLIKMDSVGSADWVKTYGGTNDDKAYSVRETIDSGYIIAGYTKSFGAGNEDIYILKTDINGDTIWTKTYGGSQYDAAFCVQQTKDSGYIFSGSRDNHLYLLKTDINGDTSQIITNKNDNSETISLYPNPFYKSTTIELPSEPHNLIIYDIIGNKVREEQVIGRTNIERGNLTKGIYLLKARSKKKMYSGKLVVK